MISNTTNLTLQTFATSENMNLFWSFVKSLLSYASPWVMIAFALVAVGLVLTIVITSFKKADQEHEDDDIEIKTY